MTILDELQVAVTTKEAIEAEIKEKYQDKLAAIEATIAAKRAALQDHLNRLKVDKIHSTDGKLFFTRTYRTERFVQDAEVVKAFLQEAGIADKYLKLDIVAVKKLAGTQAVPGVAVEKKEIFSLREVGEEKMQPEETPRQFADRVAKARAEEQV